MRPRWADLDDRERLALQSVLAFLLPRLTDRQAIDWALRLAPQERVKRVAVLDLVDRESRRIPEPWRSAWRLIEESWASGVVGKQDASAAYAAKKRLQEGDRSGALVRSITELVAPRLELGSRSASTKSPRGILDLLSVRLTSGTDVDPQTLGIPILAEPDFLISLAHSLEAALSQGLECARRTGWDGKGFPWQLGSLRRVYHVAGGGGQDPDKYHRGIAPSVKLLHEIVHRLGALQPSLACEFAERWKVSKSPVYLRLWAALARKAELVSADDVSLVLLGLDDDKFWDLRYYPELAELRACRFSDLDTKSQSAVTKRIRKLPPRGLWRSKTPRADLDRVRRARSIEELDRIQTAGGVLSRSDLDWLASTKQSFPEIPDAIGTDYGFTPGASARWVGANPERSYDALSGENRLNALEAALSATRRHWDDDPAQRAFDWLRENSNAFMVVTDLESTANAGAEFRNVWKMLGTTHIYPHGQDSSGRNLENEAQRMFALLANLPDDAAQQSIEGIAQWLANWGTHFTSSMASLWLRFWPMAVVATNARQMDDATQRESAAPAKAEDHESRVEADTLNTPAGQLVGLFLSVRPNFKTDERPFDSNVDLRAMRDAILDSSGQAKLIALHRLIEDLSYFLEADRDWAEKHLVEPLNANDPQGLALWHAIAWETQFYKVLKPIGEAMAQRASDVKLSRETRQSLAFSLVVECLHALNEMRDPAVPYHRVLQMLRSVEDEIRVHAAYAVQRFISDVASEKAPAEDLFQRGVARFMQDVWPQERSLVTPGISQAVAKIPGLAIGVFAAAVRAIERFLVPFECWGLYEYGLDTDEGDTTRLTRIDDPEKAAALMSLLNLTVGQSEGSVVPTDLTKALQRISEIAPKLESDSSYRRLSVAARRT